ncbi:MAG: hypothetical protein WC100_11685 [Sterolibacterium sp.]
MHLLLLAGTHLGENVQVDHPAVEAAEPMTLSIVAARNAVQRSAASVQQPSETSTPARQGAELLPLPAIRFYGTRELTKRPQPLGQADLDTPEIKMIVASGKMILKLWIDEAGEVIEVEVEKTELPEMLSDLTRARFKHMRFLPGERMGIPVGSVMRIEVNYDDHRMPPG